MELFPLSDIRINQNSHEKTTSRGLRTRYDRRKLTITRCLSHLTKRTIKKKITIMSYARYVRRKLTITRSLSHLKKRTIKEKITIMSSARYVKKK